MKIAFYLDPSCPFCWITSRWLLIVEKHRDLEIDWRLFSLALKNDELNNTGNDKTLHGDSHRSSHRVMRVMKAAQTNYDASLIDLYSDFGMIFHVGEQAYNDQLISDILAKHNLPAELLASANDTSYDKLLSESIKSATDIAGQDIGVPTIVFTNDDGQEVGYFGPVLQELPGTEESLKIWDGLSNLATSGSFYELKRSRPSGQPDVFSTAKC